MFQSRTWRRAASVLLTVLVLGVAFRVLSALAGSFGSIAVAFGVVAAVVAGSTWVIGHWLAGRWWPCVVSLLVLAAPLVLIALTLPRGTPLPKPSPEGHEVAYWDLATGRTVGYVEFVPANPNDEPPIVLLHGGPGGGTADGNIAWGEQLAAAGYRSYAYDQAGVGWSPRVDEAAYTVAASVADLEAIRSVIGAETMIVAGHSWGGSLAAHYAIAHEDQVAALVLSAPGPLGGPSVARTGPNLTASDAPSSIVFCEPLPFGMRVIDALAARGFTFGESLVTQNVAALIVQDHLDPSAALARGVCAGDAPGEVPRLMRNSNFNITANRSISRDLRSIDATDELAAISVPTLVVRGVCDYVPWTVHRFYRDTIPGAQMAIIDGAGHRFRPVAPMLKFLETGDSGFPDYRAAEFPTRGG